MNLVKEMPLSEGSKWKEEELLVLVSVPNPQSEQTPGIFPGIGSHRRSTGCSFSASWRELSRGVNGKCCYSPANPIALGRSVINCNEEGSWGPNYGRRVV